MSRLVLVRHARPEPLPGVPQSQWQLAIDAGADVLALRRAIGAEALAMVVASDEAKAVATAELLGGERPAVTSSAFAEVAKPWFDHAAALESATRRYLAGETLEGWEPRQAAVARFDRGLAQLGEAQPVVVTHGTVMTAWLDSVLGLSDPGEFWAQLEMPDAYEIDVATCALKRVAWKKP